MSWNRPTEQKKPACESKTNRPGKPLLALVFVAVCIFGACVYYFAFNDETTDMASTEGKSRSREEKPKRTHNSNSSSKSRVPAEERKRVGKATASKETSVAVPIATSNATDTLKSAKPKREEDNVTAVDQLLLMAADLSEGKSVPPMPIGGPGMTKAFIDSLSKPIKVLESDSERTKEIKALMSEMRQQMIDAIKDGASVEEVLRDHEYQNNENNKIRNKALKEIKELREQGQEDDASVYLQAMNQAFSQMGIATIELPKTDAEQDQEIEDNINAPNQL